MHPISALPGPIPAEAGAYSSCVSDRTGTNSDDSPQRRGIKIFRLLIHPRLCRAVIPIRQWRAISANAENEMRYRSRNDAAPRMRGRLPVLLIHDTTPHRQGTQFNISADRIFMRYSPAQAGGLLWAFPKLILQDGYIPAHAGNLQQAAHPPLPASIQPRLCRDFFSPRYQRCKDTTPLRRGILTKYETVETRFGYIPAYAGNSASAIERCGSSWIHPRLCGENPHRGKICPSESTIQPRLCGESMISSRRSRISRDTAPPMQGIRV